MKKAGLFACILALAIGSVFAECKNGVCALPGTEMAKTHHGDVTTAEMKTIVESGSAIVIDARPGAKARLPGAKVLTGTPSAEEVAKVIPSKDAPVVTYCGNTHCPLSPKLAAYLKSLGYTNVREYPEGFAGWTAAGYSTVKSM